MKTLKSILLVLSLSLLFLYCGKKNESLDNIKKSKSRNGISVSEINNTKFSNYTIDKNSQRVAEIKAVSFAGKPFENRDLKADVHLSIPDDNLEFKFTWVVNDKAIESEETEVLPNQYFKSGDWVFCKVKMINTEIKSKEIKSKYIRIIGTTPILKMKPIPQISIPGEFRYKINATLPGEIRTENGIEDMEDPENSGLEFTLLSPTDKGIFLDKFTGEIIWFISESVATSIGDRFMIKFKVSNPEGGSVISSISLSFKSIESDEIEK